MFPRTEESFTSDVRTPDNEWVPVAGSDTAILWIYT
jgi:hypothetical protein